MRPGRERIIRSTSSARRSRARSALPSRLQHRQRLRPGGVASPCSCSSYESCCSNSGNFAHRSPPAHLPSPRQSRDHRKPAKHRGRGVPAGGGHGDLQPPLDDLFPLPAPTCQPVLEPHFHLRDDVFSALRIVRLRHRRIRRTPPSASLDMLHHDDGVGAFGHRRAGHNLDSSAPKASACHLSWLLASATHLPHDAQQRQTGAKSEATHSKSITGRTVERRLVAIRQTTGSASTRPAAASSGYSTSVAGAAKSACACPSTIPSASSKPTTPTCGLTHFCLPLHPIARIRSANRKAPSSLARGLIFIVAAISSRLCSSTSPARRCLRGYPSHPPRGAHPAPTPDRSGKPPRILEARRSSGSSGRPLLA